MGSRDPRVDAYLANSAGPAVEEIVGWLCQGKTKNWKYASC